MYNKVSVLNTKFLAIEIAETVLQLKKGWSANIVITFAANKHASRFDVNLFQSFRLLKLLNDFFFV